MWNSVGMGNNLSLAALSSYFKAFLSCDKSETIKFPQRKDVVLLSFSFCYNLLWCSQKINWSLCQIILS